MLKSELGPAVDASDLSQRERNNRKMQQTRYQKDFKEAMQVFQDVSDRATFRSVLECRMRHLSKTHVRCIAWKPCNLVV